MNFQKLKRKLTQGENFMKMAIQKIESRIPMPKGEKIILDMKRHTIAKKWSSQELAIMNRMS